MRRVRQRISKGTLILLYHRVYSPDRDPQLMCVSPENFRAHLEVLCKKARIISMQELSECLSIQKVPHRAVAITFDDGYRDNLGQAKPLLEEYQAPATFFISAGYVGGKEYWWDELDRIFLSPGKLPKNLTLRVGNTEFDADLGDDSVYSERSAKYYAAWHVAQAECPTARHRAYKVLCQALAEISVSKRQSALIALRAWASSAGPTNNDNSSMTAVEVAQLSRSNFCKVGAHTLNHPRLSTISLCEQKMEIAGSKAELEAILGGRIAGFAYPFGTKNDYSLESVNFVRGAGFDWACSNFAEVVRQGAERFQLPRIIVRNWDAEAFSLFLTEWL